MRKIKWDTELKQCIPEEQKIPRSWTIEGIKVTELKIEPTKRVQDIPLFRELLSTETKNKGGKSVNFGTTFHCSDRHHPETALFLHREKCAAPTAICEKSLMYLTKFIVLELL